MKLIHFDKTFFDCVIKVANKNKKMSLLSDIENWKKFDFQKANKEYYKTFNLFVKWLLNNWYVYIYPEECEAFDDYVQKNELDSFLLYDITF